jgi:hypothetical protein
VCLRCDLEYHAAAAEIGPSFVSRAINRAVAVHSQAAAGIGPVRNASEVVKAAVDPAVARRAQLEDVTSAISAVTPGRAIEIAGAVANQIPGWARSSTR